MGDGPPRFPRGFTCPTVLRCLPRTVSPFRLRGSHPLWLAFPDPSTMARLPSRVHSGTLRQVLQPRPCNGRNLSHRNGLGSSPFARRYSGNHACFLFLRVLRCFTSPRSPYALSVVPEYDPWWVSPFGHPRLIARLAAPRGFSQPATSFIASRYQGIHRMPFLA